MSLTRRIIEAAARGSDLPLDLVHATRRAIFAVLGPHIAVRMGMFNPLPGNYVPDEPKPDWDKADVMAHIYDNVVSAEDDDGGWGREHNAPVVIYHESRIPGPLSRDEIRGGLITFADLWEEVERMATRLAGVRLENQSLNQAVSVMRVAE